MGKRNNRLVAYILVPLIFTLIGAVIFYGAVLRTAEGIILAFDQNSGDVPPAFDYGEPDILEVINTDSVQAPAYGAFYANVFCERFGYFNKIYYGSSTRILKKGIGQPYGSSLPGFGGTITLYGNNDGAFWVLEDMEKDDVIEIYTAYGDFEYRVVEAKVGYGDNPDELYPPDTGKEMLVMCTEYPFEDKNKTVETEVEKPEPDGTHKIIWAEKLSGPVVRDLEAAQ